MKKILAIIPILMLAFTLMAQPPKGPAEKGMTFGEKVTALSAVPVNDMIAKLKDKEETNVKIIGKVIEVCKSEGCWIRIETANGPMRIKMADHAFLVPLSLNGKTIVAEGIATLKETTVEMLRHYAEDAGKTKEEIAAITSPKKEVSMETKGILVL